MSWKFTRTVGVCAVIKADRESDVVHSFRNSTVPYIQSKIIKNTLAMSKVRLSSLQRVLFLRLIILLQR